MDLYETAAMAAKVKTAQAKATLNLLAEGNTVPFIARYRKEMTGNLDEEVIRIIQESYQYAQNLKKRKEDVLRLISMQGKLTEELEKAIEECTKLAEVEDIYRPYKQKKKTRASEAKRKGLDPLARFLLSAQTTLDPRIEAKKYLGEEVTSIEEALQGAMDILAEESSDDPGRRQVIRQHIYQQAKLQTERKKEAEDPKKIYQFYYHHQERLRYMEAHRIMAVDRAEKEGVITVSLAYEQQSLLEGSVRKLTNGQKGAGYPYVEKAVADGLKRLAYPSLEKEVRHELSAKAQAASIEVFSYNVEKLLLQAPLVGRVVLGYDPAFRTGCKLAVLDKTGRLLEISKIYPTAPHFKKAEAEKELLRLFAKYQVEIVAIGNGTASRESEAFVAEVIRRHHLTLQYTLVSEAGASVYSASEIARKEFPDLQVEERSAVSIGRRILDPLAELIKIDPESIGVGQYQHDLPKKELRQRLAFVVEKCVNRVGVDLMTASPELLQAVSGISSTVAKNIVEYRNQHGKFVARKQLQEVKGLGAKAYEQCAGFLRIHQGEEVLDATAIHPESYPIAKAILQRYQALPGSEELRHALQGIDREKLAKECASDRYTIEDILEALQEPQRDYRERYDAPLLRQDILAWKDLKIGDHLQGVVRNVVDFGAFVDIGLHEDGLIHRSQFGKKLAIPQEMVTVGEIVDVEVIGIDKEKEKVSLALLIE